MSSILPRDRLQTQWLAKLLSHDYFPGLDPYIAWLRQPIGWFVLATVASVLVGLYLTPLAWSIAAGLLSLMAIGGLYPWLTVRWTQCVLVPECHELEEDESHTMLVTVHNRLPWPLMGLMVEGFLVLPTPASDANDDEAAESLPVADVALDTVPGLSSATFRLPIHPRYRGRYPQTAPRLACAFPFGIWTAQRRIGQVQALAVRPRRLRISGLTDQTGTRPHLCGTGTRTGGSGDFLGLRDFREGDSIRNIHWAHTARMDSLVVCERGAAQQTTWEIYLGTACVAQGTLAWRENLAWRVRLASSLVNLLHQQSIPFELTIQAEEQWTSEPTLGLRANQGQRFDRILDRLTDVPLDGIEADHSASASSAIEWLEPKTHQSNCWVTILPASHPRYVQLRLQRTSSSYRMAANELAIRLDLEDDIASQLAAWLQRIEHARSAA